jgi:CRISPR-associated protein (TIGR03984 family)
MTTLNGFSAVMGCEIRPLENGACEEHFHWFAGVDKAKAPEGAPDLKFALAHCDDGVTWAKWDADGNRWRTGHEANPKVSPPVRRETLQELRLFGEAGEVLIWRTEEGLCGRGLWDREEATDPEKPWGPLPPAGEDRILRGDFVREKSAEGFSYIADRAGAEQVIPLEVSKKDLENRRVRLQVRHYFQRDEQNTGAVRVAATRLVGIAIKEGKQ